MSICYKRLIRANNFSYIAGYKIMYKINCIAMHQQQCKNEIKKISLFIIATKGIIYLKIKFFKWKICTLKTTKHCWQKLRRTSTNQKVSYVHRLESLILLKWLYSPSWSTGSTQSILKANLVFFLINKLILKLIWKLKGFKITRTVFQKKNKVGWLTFSISNFKTYYQATVIKAMLYGIRVDI